MAKNTQDKKTPNRRTEVNALPQQKKELSKAEAKKVKGGLKAEMYCEDAIAKPTGGGSGSSG